MNKLKILYAEDEVDSAKSIIRMLSNIADVDYVDNGVDAYEKYVSNNHYDLIITDIKMPRMSGIEAIEKLKDEGLNPYTIITTAFNDTDFLLNAIELKVDKFILKPIDIDILFTYINEFKKNKEIEFQLEEEKRNFEHYRKIVDDQNVISITDIDGNIKFVNDNFCKLSGYSSAELLGQSHNIINHPNSKIEYFQELWSTIKNGDVFKSTVQNLSKDGNSFWLRGIIAPFFDNYGEIKEFISIREDATKEILQKKELEDLKEKQFLKDLEKASAIQDDTLVKYIPFASFIVENNNIVSKNIMFDDIVVIELTSDEEIYLKIFEQITFGISEIEFSNVIYKIKIQNLYDDKTLIILVN